MSQWGVPAGPADVPLVMQAMLFFFWSLMMIAGGMFAQNLRKCPQCPPPHGHGGDDGGWDPFPPELPPAPDPERNPLGVPYEFSTWDIDQELKKIMKQEEAAGAR